MKQYTITEIFETIQGEGSYAGTPAMFVRLSGCNMWSGDDEDRIRDSNRNDARCPMFCDTDFKPRMKLSGDELVELVSAYAEKGGRLLVITGGEPLLQLDAEISARVLDILQVSIETNGTVALSDDMMLLCTGDTRLWITCSPKQAADRLRLDPRFVSELKVVYPNYNPVEYRAWINANPAKLYIQPVATAMSVGVSMLDDVVMSAAAQWCMDNPAWNLSLQTHKFLRLA